MGRISTPLACLVMAVFGTLPLGAQNPQLYPFGIDQDRLHGAPDFSFLNHPLTAADRVFVKNGHFYTLGADLKPNTPDDRRVRFFGVNLAFGANFPAQADGVRIAKRLRRMGVNLVRLHHMDSSPDPADRPANANSILLNGPYPTFNDVSLQRLRDFLAALAAEGIYADLNLHVGYLFRPAIDLVPALPNQPIPTQSKPLQIFYPRMIQLQRQYAQQLIARLELKDSPSLAMVEINNESSLVQAWQWGQLDPVLAGEYRTALETAWNRFLAAKYGTAAALTRAWGASTADGSNLLNGKWTLEQGHGKSGTLTVSTAGAEVQPGQGSGWLILKQTGFHLAAGTQYVLHFEARADLSPGKTLTVPAMVMRDVSPWDSYVHTNVTLTNQWRTFTVAAMGAFAIQDSGRVSLDVGLSPAPVYARNMSLVTAGRRGLAAAESIEAGNISLPAAGEAAAGRSNDYTAFLIATDRNFVNVLRDTVRAGTDSLVPITGTQMGYGGLAILDSQDGLDYQDNHFYIDHYNFPNTAWDRRDWRIRDAAAADSAWLAFVNMAWARQAGKPYTVSEFNQPWPNTHAAELDPSLAAYAAFQDWDAIIHFAYSHGRNWDDGVPNGFNLNGDWTKFPNIGQAAWLFRTAAVKPGTGAVSVPVSTDQRLQATAKRQSITDWITRVAGLPKEVALDRRVELAKDSAQSVGLPAAETSELHFDAASRRLVLDAPRAAGVFGTLGRDKVTAGPLDFELAPSARGFASLLITALDDRDLTSSGRLLLSVPGYALRASQALKHYPGTADWWTLDNSGNPAKPSGDLDGGSRPTYMERVEVYVTLRTRATALTVNALDGAGDGIAALRPSEVQPVAGGFRIHLNGDGQPQSPWFAITAAQHR